MNTFIDFISQVDYNQLVELVKELYDVLTSLYHVFRGTSTAIITNSSGS